MDSNGYVKRIESVEHWRALAPALPISDGLVPVPAAGSGAPDALRPAGWWHEQRPHMVEEGYVELEGAVPLADAGALAYGIDRLVRAGEHPLFVFVYDAAWRILERLAPLCAAVLGHEFEVLEDFWAWKIDPIATGDAREPGTGRGWPPHRGWYDAVTRDDGLPAMMNLWVALTDAGPLNACMYIVPTCLDPGFAGDLRSHAFEPQHARALPTRAGSVLAWSANALHWGGTASRRTTSPRISLSFTARRPGFAAGGARALELARPLPFRKRLDLIADQVLTYGENEASATEAARRWATLVAGMRACRR